MPKVDRLFSLLLPIFDPLLDALRFIRLRPSTALHSGRRESFPSQTVSSVSGAPSRASATQGSCQVDPGIAFQTLPSATGSYYRQAGHIRPLASARLSTVLEVEIAAPRAASNSCRTPETYRGNGS